MGKNLLGKKLPTGFDQLPDGRYRFREKINGEQFVLTDQSFTELKKKVEAKRVSISQGRGGTEKRITVSAWFEEWLTVFKPDLKAGTRATYKQVFKLYIAPVIGKRQLKDTKATHIQRLINNMAADGFSYSRVNITYIILHAMFEKAQAIGYLNYSPMANKAVSMPTKRQLRKDSDAEEKCKAMTKEQLNDFLVYASGSVYCDLYTFLARTGVRIGEATGLRWKDIDFSKNEIHIECTMMYLRGEGRTLDDAKCEASKRTIPMTATIKSLLLGIYKEQTATRTLLGSNWKTEKGLEGMVFQYPTGGAFWNEGVRKDLNGIIRKIRNAGIDFPHITPHTFRHTFAVLAIQSGVNPKALQKLLGHSNFAITMDVYADVLEASKLESMQIIEQAM